MMPIRQEEYHIEFGSNGQIIVKTPEYNKYIRYLNNNYFTSQSSGQSPGTSRSDEEIEQQMYWGFSTAINATDQDYFTPANAQLLALVARLKNLSLENIIPGSARQTTTLSSVVEEVGFDLSPSVSTRSLDSEERTTERRISPAIAIPNARNKTPSPLTIDASAPSCLLRRPEPKVATASSQYESSPPTGMVDKGFFAFSVTNAGQDLPSSVSSEEGARAFARVAPTNKVSPLRPFCERAPMVYRNYTNAPQWKLRRDLIHTQVSSAIAARGAQLSQILPQVRNTISPPVLQFNEKPSVVNYTSPDTTPEIGSVAVPMSFRVPNLALQ